MERPRDKDAEYMHEINRLEGERDRLRARVKQAEEERDELLDCKERLRELGDVCGCDHVESSDERLSQANHISEAIVNLQDERRNLAMMLRRAIRWAKRQPDHNIIVDQAETLLEKYGLQSSPLREAAEAAGGEK